MFAKNKKWLSLYLVFAVVAIIAGGVVLTGCGVPQDLAEMSRYSTSGDGPDNVIEWNGVQYYSFGAADASLIGEQIGFVNGDKKDKVYAVNGHPSEEWIINSYKAEMEVIIELFKEKSVENIPSEFRPGTMWRMIYEETLESYLKQDTALNENIDYIAIDMKSLEYADAADKEEIKSFFERYYKPVKDADLDDLKEEGLFAEETMSLPNGVILQIEEVRLSEKEIIITGQKYRSGLGANGFETKWTKSADGNWEFQGTAMTWIS